MTLNYYAVVVTIHDLLGNWGKPMMIKTDKPYVESVAPKPYVKPTLVKGPVLSSVTAAAKTSLGPPTCWVARAAFGVADIRWMIFRAWLLEDAPAWFRALYLRHGEMVGAWLASRTGPRRVVRVLMMPAVQRKARGDT